MRKTKEISVGNVIIGNNYPIVIQSMTNTKTSDISSTVKQINDLANLGAQIVRLSVSDEKDALAISEIKKHVHVPLVADIHFSYKLALLAITSGADKIRINPGNLGIEGITQIVQKCKEKKIPIRIGINSGSLEKELYEKYHGVTAQALLESMEKHIRLLETLDFHDIVLSIKATNIKTTIEANRMIAEKFNYPIHIGLTEAGTINGGTIRSSYVLGTLLNDGIGDTIRVSLTGNPLKEIPIAKEILSMFDLYQKPTLISCPTCGRTAYHMEPIVNEIEEFLNQFNFRIKVAIMGCAVNGPGEAKDADIGVAGGKGEAILFKKGKIIKKLPESEIITELKKEILKMIDMNN